MNIEEKNEELPLTLRNLYITFAEFFKVWLNIICYERELYPRESFRLGSVTSFGLTVPINRHPDVIVWQNGLIESLLLNFLLEDDEEDSESPLRRKKAINKVKEISLVIFEQEEVDSHDNNNNRRPEERFVIDLSKLKAVSGSSEMTNRTIADLSWILVYEGFKGLVYDILTNLRDVPNHKQADDNSCKPVQKESHKKTFDIFLSTDRSFLPEKTLNASDDSDWIIEPNKAAYGHASLDATKSGGASTRGLEKDPVLSSEKNVKIKVRHFRSVEIAPLLIYCHVDKFVR